MWPFFTALLFLAWALYRMATSTVFESLGSYGIVFALSAIMLELGDTVPHDLTIPVALLIAFVWWAYVWVIERWC